MEILVLGATGNTGSEVVKQLSEKNYHPKVVLRDANKAEALGLTRNDVIQGDYSDAESLERAFKGIDRVYIAMPPHPDNISWMDHVIHAAQRNKTKHIVKLSGFGASDDAGSDIIRTHAKTDVLLKNSGITYTLLQPNSFYQNFYSYLSTIKDHGKFYLALGDAAQSVVDLRDVAAVAVSALTERGHDNKTYRLSGPESLTFAQQAAIVTKTSGKEIEYVPISQSAAEEALLSVGLDPWLSGQLAEIQDWFSQGAYVEVTNDIENVLGKPARNFESFATEFAKAI